MENSDLQASATAVSPIDIKTSTTCASNEERDANLPPEGFIVPWKHWDSEMKKLLNEGRLMSSQDGKKSTYWGWFARTTIISQGLLTEHSRRCVLCGRGYQSGDSFESHITAKHSSLKKLLQSSTSDSQHPIVKHKRKADDITPIGAHLTTSRSKNCNQKLLSWLVCSGRPFSLVEDPGFREFVQAIWPDYIPSTRQTLTKHLTAAGEQDAMALKELFSTNRRISITTDAATDDVDNSYVAVTAHFIGEDWKLYSRCMGASLSNSSHTAEQIHRDLEQIISEVTANPVKVETATTDNGSNFTSGIRAFLNEREYGEHVPCMCHTVQLAVKDALADGIAGEARACITLTQLAWPQLD